MLVPPTAVTYGDVAGYPTVPSGPVLKPLAPTSPEDALNVMPSNDPIAYNSFVVCIHASYPLAVLERSDSGMEKLCDSVLTLSCESIVAIKGARAQLRFPIYSVIFAPGAMVCEDSTSRLISPAHPDVTPNRG